MTLNLSQIKTIDVHCHPFIANQEPYTPEEFLKKLSLSVIPDMFKAGEKGTLKRIYPGMNMYMQITLKKLAEFFSCKPFLRDVVEKRNEMAQDFSKYTKLLFQDAHLQGLLVDFGYPTPQISRNEFKALTGVPQWEIHRIELVMDQLREECTEFGEFIEKYRDNLRQALNKKHMLGLKSIIAYRSGLEIGEKDENAARKQYEDFHHNERAKAKSFRDFCLHIAMEECTRANKVMHIHTGVGDGEVVLPKASPSLLIDMLRDKKYKDTKVHFVHGGYPWMEEAGFIASILPNVYLDISLQNPFMGHGVERIISQIFETAPFDKVMYGSDAFTVPEMNWLGVLLFKECFERVLNDWMKKDYMDKEMAQEVAEGVLFRNFENCYKEQLKELSV
ncbi:amidohydrolase family protein [Scopulibacillus cellulosilyticus]|uniref:Amidohydrolase family protein n=1 Tax=Scopulibacillus cellulosilyticus TaxID=2665665 RepID=A0ABW2PX33_9BACL